MSNQWRPGQKEAVLKRAREAGMLGDPVSGNPSLEISDRVIGRKEMTDPLAELPAPKRPTHVFGKMNKTEEHFARILDAKKNHGDLLEWAFEPFALRLAEDTTYTPDFVSVARYGITIAELRRLASSTALEASNADLANLLYKVTCLDPGAVTFYEIKGPQIWEKNRIKYKVAVEHYPWARFALWQRDAGEWKQLL